MRSTQRKNARCKCEAWRGEVSPYPLNVQSTEGPLGKLNAQLGSARHRAEATHEPQNSTTEASEAIPPNLTASDRMVRLMVFHGAFSHVQVMHPRPHGEGGTWPQLLDPQHIPWWLAKSFIFSGFIMVYGKSKPSQKHSKSKFLVHSSIQPGPHTEKFCHAQSIHSGDIDATWTFNHPCPPEFAAAGGIAE